MIIKLINGVVFLNNNELKQQDIFMKDGTVLFKCDENPDLLIDCKGKMILPGLIDLHVHCYFEKTELGLRTDSIGVKQGVSTVVDAGSSGADDYEDFLKQQENEVTKVYAFINYSKIGLTKQGKELSSWDYIDEEKLSQVVTNYPDSIKGIKLRASGSVVKDLGFSPIRKGKEYAKKMNLPVMIHIGNQPPSIEEVLSIVEKKDIITHIFHGKPGGVLEEDGTIKEIVRNKYQEGVIFDIGHGGASLNFEVAKKAIAQGIIPQTISSDLHSRSKGKKLHGLVEVMSKMLACGMNETEIFQATTGNPGKIIGVSNQIVEGAKVDLCILEKIDQQTAFIDSEENEIKTDEYYQVFLVIQEGRIERITEQYENK